MPRFVVEYWVMSKKFTSIAALAAFVVFAAGPVQSQGRKQGADAGGGGAQGADSGEYRGRSPMEIVGAKEFKEKGVWFGRPAKGTPEEQLAYAAELEAGGSVRSATSAYNTVVKEWAGEFPEAAKTAQLKVAELYLKRGRPADAFGEYQYFIEKFTDADDGAFMGALARQFAIANDELARIEAGKGRTEADVVAAMFHRVVRNAPDWDRAAESQFKRGMCLEHKKEWFEAVFVYEALVSRFPRSEFVTEALYRSAFARVRLSDKKPRDERMMRNAIQSLREAFDNDRSHAMAEEAVGKHDRLMSSLSRMNFEKAAFYDRIRKNPKAAVIAYKAFAKEFAGWPEAELALKRAEELGIRN